MGQLRRAQNRLLGGGTVGPALLGCGSGFETTECLRSEEASVCVVRDGGILEVRADGLRPESNVEFVSPLFGPNEIPVSGDGDFDDWHFFDSRDSTFEGVVSGRSDRRAGVTVVRAADTPRNSAAARAGLRRYPSR